jgi:hypothetical protein
MASVANRRKTIQAEIWKDREVAKAFLDERSLLIPDHPRQLEVILRVVGFHCPQPRRILDLGSGDAITPAAKKVIYQPEAPARDPVRFPRWRFGLIRSSMRNFLAGVISY